MLHSFNGFIQRAAILSAVLAIAILSARPSVCMSACLSVTRRYRVKTIKLERSGLYHRVAHLL